MKKFKFSLQRLLEYKDKSLDHEKDTLAAIRRELQVLVEQRQELARQFREANDRFNARAAIGMTQQDINAEKAYIKSLQAQIDGLDVKIASTEVRVEKQLLVVVELTKEVSSIEKLKEHQLEDYKKREQKEDELFIEEFVTNSTYSN